MQVGYFKLPRNVLTAGSPASDGSIKDLFQSISFFPKLSQVEERLKLNKQLNK